MKTPHRERSWREKMEACTRLATRLGLHTVVEGDGLIFWVDAKHPPFQVASFDVALAMLTYIEALYNASPMHSESQREAQMQFIVQSAHATLEFTQLLAQSMDARLANIDERRRMIEIGGEFISNPARG